MSDYKDYYKILGVGKNATEAEIKKAFKTQARKYHPDMHAEKDKAAMTEKFKDVNEAYEVLSDKQKRTIYDQVGSGEYQNYARGGGASTGRGRSSYGNPGAGGYYQYSSGGANPFGGGVNFNGTGGFNASDFSDFFQQIFGGMGGMGGFGGGRSSRRGANPFAGYGAGQAASGDEETNLTLDLADAYRGGLVGLTLPNGRVVQAKFPAKIADGSKIKLKGLGNPGPNGAGDLYVNVKISPNTHFRLDGKDIYHVVDIMPWTAALGGSVSVRMPDNTTVKIKVPAGSHSGRKLKLSGKGLGKTGDMYIEIMINNPNILTKRQKELFTLLKETEE